jgi:hypothetical protein
MHDGVLYYASLGAKEGRATSGRVELAWCSTPLMIYQYPFAGGVKLVVCDGAPDNTVKHDIGGACSSRHARMHWNTDISCLYPLTPLSLGPPFPPPLNLNQHQLVLAALEVAIKILKLAWYCVCMSACVNVSMCAHLSVCVCVRT